VPSLARRANVQGWLAGAVSDALRRDSADELTAALALLVRLLRREGYDDRDAMTCLTPIHDCARRLGVEPAALFDEAAAAAPSDLADVLRAFGSRDEVTLAAFGWVLREDSNGPWYAAAD
jgi:hypothetical protein